ncbi:MAG: hypothetical protein ACOVT5_09455, partial [Armatimonadaceae bacterium]
MLRRCLGGGIVGGSPCLHRAQIFLGGFEQRTRRALVFLSGIHLPVGDLESRRLHLYLKLGIVDILRRHKAFAGQRLESRESGLGKPERGFGGKFLRLGVQDRHSCRVQTRLAIGDHRPCRRSSRVAGARDAGHI